MTSTLFSKFKTLVIFILLVLLLVAIFKPDVAQEITAQVVASFSP